MNKAATERMYAEFFFYDHAGYSYAPAVQTPEQGRVETAESLARAEAWAADLDVSVDWNIDLDIDSSDFSDDPEPWELWSCFLRHEGETVSLHGIDFGRDGHPDSNPYARVIQAELAEQLRETLELREETI